MKPTFHHRLVNREFEDPSLYVRFIRERRAILFDAGNIASLGPGDIQKITDIFITHMHIDHFIGFDLILRALLRRETPLRVYGPEGIIEGIEGKLKGYSWNLIRDYPIEIEVFSIGEKIIRQASFYAKESFRRIDRDERDFKGIILIGPYFSVRTSILSHGIPCLGYSIEEDFHINIDKAILNNMGLPVGPWLSEFKKMIREGVGHDREIIVSGRSFRLGSLMDIVRITKGQKVSYVVDASPTVDNINKIIDLIKGSDTFYCEAYFLHEDMERARERNHLTARIAGEIAKRAGVRDLILIHFSPKYRDRRDDIISEAMEAFMRSGQ
ncbi:MAG: ribonuclease Z [Thermodesulfovibrionales bacterium]